MPSAASCLLEALHQAGVTHVFANFGSDHPAIIEAIAAARVSERTIPAIVTAPNEMVALSCAHGAAQLTGQAQAVLVHVDCGTQAMGGAIHNAARGRVPVFVFAGLSPFTQEGELPGSRNEFIHWLQDVSDQRGIMRAYTKYDTEFRTGRNIPQLVHRAMQIAQSEPKGPVYLTAAREVLEEDVEPARIDPSRWRPLPPLPLSQTAVAEIAEALARAARPLVVTTYLGRNPAAVPELVRVCERLGVGVLESVPFNMNYPHDAAMYQGNQWGEPRQNPRLAEADMVLVIDSDVPWTPVVNRPSPEARIIHVDVDPLKQTIALWYIQAHSSYRADAAAALRQLNAHLDIAGFDGEPAARRIAHFSTHHRTRALQVAAREERPESETITAEFLVACVRRAIDADTVVLSEGITNYPAICDGLARTRPGTLFSSGGSSLGWNGGAAIGMKLVAPEKTFVALTGDGSYMFSIPSTVHWMARRYATPFLQIVFDNGGWKAPKLSTLAVHPSGHAARANDMGTSFDPPPDYAGIAAAAGGAWAKRVERPDEVERAVREGLAVVREEKRCAVIAVQLAHL